MNPKQFQILKVDDSHGLIIGYAIVCKEKGERYFDLQDEHVPEDAMVKAAIPFMQNAVGCVMHKRDENGDVIPGGQVVFAFPLTTDIAKALDIDAVRTGLLVAFRPSDPEDLAKARRGEYRGFSIGGAYIETETEEDS